MTSTDLKSVPAIDLDFRPKSYWGPQSLEKWYGTRLTGELRRKAIMKEADEYDGSPHFLSPTLDPGLRSSIAGFHPALMSGEFLPPLMEHEVEIARVVLRSTMGDVTSIRARRTKHRIIYRIVDEYMDEDPYKFQMRPRSSVRPISLKQLVAAINENNLIDGPRDMNFEHMDYRDVFDFANVSSEYYPQIAEWFDTANLAWRDARAADCGDEDEDDDDDLAP